MFNKRTEIIIDVVCAVIIVSQLWANVHLYEKSKTAYERGQRAQYMEINNAIETALQSLEALKMPPKGLESLEVELSPKGEAHPDVIVSESLAEWVYNNCDEETVKVVFAIAWADTNCGQNLTTPNNPGNVNNNDRGNRVGYFTMLDGWKAIVDVLNNKYIGNNTLIGQLSEGGRSIIGSTHTCANAIDGYKCYATSEYNWNKNVQRALASMGLAEMNEYSAFRLN